MFDMINIFEVFLPQLLRYPNAADPLNGEAAALLMRDPRGYDNKVKGKGATSSPARFPACVARLKSHFRVRSKVRDQRGGGRSRRRQRRGRRNELRREFRIRRRGASRDDGGLRTRTLLPSSHSNKHVVFAFRLSLLSLSFLSVPPFFSLLSSLERPFLMTSSSFSVKSGVQREREAFISHGAGKGEIAVGK